MGWQTSAPSLPSGSSYGTAQTYRHNANAFSYSYEVSIARLTDNKVSIKVYSVKNWHDPDYPPNYQVFSVGSDRTYPAGSAAATRYWVGTLNSGSTASVSVGGSSTNSGSGTTYHTFTVTGPAYVSKYTVSYNGNTSTSGSVSSQTKTYGSNITLRSNGYTKTGYTFLRWNTAANGSGTNYNEGATYSANANATMYAQWQIITYTITYKANGGTGSDVTQTKNYGTAVATKPASTFTRTNYTFLYWNTKADGTGTTYYAGESYNNNAAVTLYAIWKKNNIPVYVNDNGTIRQVEKAYVNDSGTIKECTVYLNDNGTIRALT